MAIGSVSVEVVPDARNFWRRVEEQTGGGRHDVSVEVNADTAKARAQLDALNKSADKSTFQMHALRDAIALIGPAAVPIGAVALGAFAGLVPTLAAVSLGIKGIVDDYKAGSLQTSQFGGDISALQRELHTLQQTAAGGLLNGLDTAMQSLRPAFGEVNKDTAVLSQQFGQILGKIAPGLVRLFTQLNPLFVTFGNALEHGAGSFERWASSSDSVSKFVAYVQAELPHVEQLFANLITTASHLIQGLAPLGGGVVMDLRLLSQVLNAIPVDVLSKLETGALAVYAAFRTYGAISAIVNRVSAAQAAFAARQAASAAAVQAASLASQAAVAEEASAVASARAEEAAATAESSASIAASLEGTQSVLAAEAAAAAEAAIEFAAAMDAEAAAAAEAAAEISASAEAAAAASSAAGEAAAVGWSAMLGPIGAVVAGVGILATALLGSHSANIQATQDINDYTSALERSNGAINDNVRALAAQKLEQSGALAAAAQLGIGAKELTNAVLGNGPALEAAQRQLKAWSATVGQSGGAATDAFSAQMYTALKKVQSALGGQSGALKTAIANAKLYRDAMKRAKDGTDSVTQSSSGVASALGATNTAYQLAEAAARKSTQQARQQTIQWQLENDAADLLTQSINKLNGATDTYKESQNAFQQQLVTLVQGIKSGSTSIRGLSSDAIANRGNLLQAAEAAKSTAAAYGQMKNSSAAGRQELVKLRQQIIENAAAHGEDRNAVAAYIDEILKIPSHIPPTKAQIDDTQAVETINHIQYLIDHINGNITVRAHGSGTVASLNASGGYISGPGSGTSDSIPAWLSNGEYVVNAKQTAKHRAMLESINKGVQGFAGGGIVANNGASSASKNPIFIVDGQRYQSLDAAKNAARTDFRAQVKLGVTIEHQGFSDWKKALDSTVAAAHAAFGKIIQESRKLGLSESVIQRLQDQNTRLDKIVQNRNTLSKELGTPPAPPTEYDKLANAIQRVHTAMSDLRQEAATVAQAVRSVFDVTTAGTGPNGNQTPTGNRILAQQRQAAANARTFVRDIRELASKIPGQYLNELAQQGPAALPQVEALMSLSNSQLKQLSSAERSINTSARGLGQFIGQRDYGADVKAAEKQRDKIENRIKDMKDQIHHDQQRILAESALMRKELAKHIDRLEKRPVQVIAPNGKVLWEYVEKGRQKSGRRG
jgi:hypothetical protein